MKRTYKILLFLFILTLTTSLWGCKRSTDQESVGNTQSATGDLDWQTQYDLGMRYLNEGNYEEAILAFTAMLQIDPKNPDLYLARAEAYLAAGDTVDNLASALTDYQTAISLDPFKAGAWEGLIQIYVQQKETDLLIETLREALKTVGPNTQWEVLLAETILTSADIIDPDGYYTKQTMYDLSGAVLWIHTYTYENGLNTSASSYDGVGNLLGEIPILYDEDGFSTQSYTEYADGTMNRIVYFTDDQGLYVTSEYSLTGELIKTERTSSENTPDGFVSTTYIYDAVGTQIGHRIFEYTEEVQSNYYYDANGQLESYQVTSTNGDGHFQDATYHSDGSLKEMLIWISDESGRSVYMDTYDGNNTLTQHSLIMYNAEGEYTGEITYDGEENLEHYFVYE